MKLRKFLVVILLVQFFTTMMVAQIQPSSVVLDPDARKGHLDNGLTYYIRRNAQQKQHADFYLVKRVGSICESANQCGVSTLLQYMCFSGTEHFTRNGVVNYCNLIGLKFGKNLNAYTTTDQTVCYITSVPTDNQNVVDSCLLIMKDWVKGLLLKPEDIDVERGMVRSCFHLRNKAQMKMLSRNMPTLYPGSAYGQCLPDNQTSIIDTISPNSIRKFYDSWYRTDNQAVILVGDIDVNLVESKIKQMFSSIPKSDKPIPVIDDVVPDNNEPIIIVDKDKDLLYNNLIIMQKVDAIPDSNKVNMDYLAQKFLYEAIAGLINARLAEKAKEANCPYLQGMADYGDYLMSKSKKSLSISILPKEGKTEEVLKTVINELKGVQKTGFTDTEYQNYKNSFCKELESRFQDKGNINNWYVQQYINHYMYNEPISSVEEYLSIMKKIVNTTTIEDINGIAKKLLAFTGRNMVVFSMNQDKSGVHCPSVTSLKNAIE